MSGGSAPPASRGTCNIYANSAAGYLVGPGDSCSWSINAGSRNYLEVPFSYPKGSVKFLVEVIGQDGHSVLGDFDLDNGEVIQLSGGGLSYLTIRSNAGAGNWSMFVEIVYVIIL